jgi:hypothetical protein
VAVVVTENVADKLTLAEVNVTDAGYNAYEPPFPSVTVNATVRSLLGAKSNDNRIELADEPLTATVARPTETVARFPNSVVCDILPVDSI